MTSKINNSQPQRLNSEEKRRLSQYIELMDWEFESLIRSKCRDIHTCLRLIDGRWEKFTIYGLDAVRGDKEVPCTSGFYLFYYGCLYGSRSIEDILHIPDLIQMDFEREKYEQQMEEREARKEKRKKAA